MKLDELQIDYVSYSALFKQTYSNASVKHVEGANARTGEGVADALKWLRQRVNTPLENRLQVSEVKSP